MTVDRLVTSIIALDFLREFVYELAVREGEVAHRLYKVANWPLFEGVEEWLHSFDEQIAEVLECAKDVDRETWMSMVTLIGSSKIADLVARLYVQIKVERSRMESPVREVLRLYTSTFYSVTGLKLNRSLSPLSAIPLEDILTTLHRLVAMARRVKAIYKRSCDAEAAFWVDAGINNSEVLLLIDSALAEVDIISIPVKQKRRIVALLNEAKASLAEDSNVSWSKIVGALVIVATILSGLADAKQAYENVQKALRHILGPAVEDRRLREQPPALPEPKSELV